MDFPQGFQGQQFVGWNRTSANGAADAPSQHLVDVRHRLESRPSGILEDRVLLGQRPLSRPRRY